MSEDAMGTPDAYPELVEEAPMRSPEAEMASLGSMLLSESAAERLVMTLDESDFSRPANRLVFRAMKALAAENLTIDIVTLKDQLSNQGTLASVGGIDYLTEIDLFVPSVVNSGSYAGIVLDKAARRALVTALEDLERAVRTNRPLAEIDQLLLGLSPLLRRARPPKSDPTWSDRVRAQDAQRDLGGVPTGNAELDALMEYDGLTNGQITLVMAHSGGGKTTWMLGAIFAACDRGERCAILTFADNTYEDIVRRALRWKCGIPDLRSATGQAQRLRADGYVVEGDSLLRRFKDAQEEIDAWDLEVFDAAEDDEGGTFEAARAWLLRKVDEGMARSRPKRMTLAGWDYAQEIGVGATELKRLRFYDQQAYVAREMARLCRSVAFPFVVPVQFTRTSEGKEEIADCKVWEKVCELWLRVRDHGVEIRKRRRGGLTSFVPGHRHDNSRWAFVPNRESRVEVAS